MPNFHPDTSTLNDYAAGTLDTALSIAVKAHMEFCPECRMQAQQIVQAGAYLFESSDQVGVSDDLLSKIMLKVGDAENLDNKANQNQQTGISHTVKRTPAATKKLSSDLPIVIQKLIAQPIENIAWQKLSTKLKFARMKTGDKKNELAFYDIKAGGSVPHHQHHSDEVTLVLKGSFSDEDGVYRKGDYVVRTRGEKHSIAATQNEDCLCLAVQETPIAFTGWFRLLNPLLKVQAS